MEWTVNKDQIEITLEGKKSFDKYRLLTEVFHNFDELLHNSCFQGYNSSYILL